MRTAVIHDWLVTYAGAERVLEQLLKLYPAADVYCVADFLPDSQREFLRGHQVITSFIQKLPWARRAYRQYLPLMPLAVEQWDLSQYQLVVSSSHAVAKGVITGPDTLHLSYVHSPLRYAWDMQGEYLREAGLDHGMKGWVVKYLLHRLRLWDVRTAAGVDGFAANSAFISRRIRKCYRRESTVIHPPVDTEQFTPDPAVQQGDFYVAASRLVSYKRMDLIVAAFSRMPRRKLLVIGEGPEEKKLRALAGPNVKFLGYRSSQELLVYLRQAKAFLFAAQEDFGIAPVEAQACGTPVIGYGRGGLLETVRPLDGAGLPTGVFFQEQTVASLCAAVEQFEARKEEIHPEECRRNAERFGAERFRREFAEFVRLMVDNGAGQ